MARKSMNPKTWVQVLRSLGRTKAATWCFSIRSYDMIAWRLWGPADLQIKFGFRPHREQQTEWWRDLEGVRKEKKFRFNGDHYSFAKLSMCAITELHTLPSDMLFIYLLIWWRGLNLGPRVCHVRALPLNNRLRQDLSIAAQAVLGLVILLPWTITRLCLPALPDVFLVYYHSDSSLEKHTRFHLPCLLGTGMMALSISNHVSSSMCVLSEARCRSSGSHIPSHSKRTMLALCILDMSVQACGHQFSESLGLPSSKTWMLYGLKNGPYRLIYLNT